MLKRSTPVTVAVNDALENLLGRQAYLQQYEKAMRCVLHEEEDKST